MNQRIAETGAVIQGERYRFTVLTPQMIRLEYQKDGKFVDALSQRVQNRRFPVPQYEVRDLENSLEIKTEYLHLKYNKQEFAANGLSIAVKVEGYVQTWHYGDEIEDLKGTARTLDQADGAIPLEAGLISRGGFTVLDDSKSILLTEDGWVAAREQEGPDLYFFGYGHEYEKCLKDFYRLCGETPLIPRFALGNWWSRYYKYTQEEYQKLISRFEEEEIPLSVAVIDMDWHLVDIDPAYGSGWTGYTWNEELFPDYRGFLKWLHRHHLKVSLNVHPADGVRAFEKQYPEMARAMGMDPGKKETVGFDLTNRELMKAHFDVICHPYEEDGVDFWWLDWQQGTLTQMEGLDPLWMLNHLYYQDSCRKRKRGMTFSRYAGIGSHRYPIGFSGDTVVSWESLDFQPYFTATASNAGYGWWSHDIGGHMFGYRDEELTTRWVQLGVFSPILRLHSTCNVYIHKEPWLFHATYRETMGRYLRLRHELIPYLYSMNVLASRDGQPLVRPMYYQNPRRREAYEVPNEYYFGTELLACPITQKSDETGLACFQAWLPEGKWIDIFNGRIYEGNRCLTLVRDVEQIPVLSKAGGIVPYAVLTEEENGVENPSGLRVQIFAGNDGSFHLYEDNDDNGRWTDTCLAWDWNGKKLTIHGAKGALQGIPERRSWELQFVGITESKTVQASIDGNEIEAKWTYDGKRNVLSVHISEVPCVSELTVRLSKETEMAENHIPEQMEELFGKVDMVKYDDMWKIYELMQRNASVSVMLSTLECMEMPKRARLAVQEILLA
ncbi:TIM-barrel domain-containing protein [Roseburia hominis]